MRPKYHLFVCLEQREPGHPKGCCFEKHGALIYDKFRMEIENKGLSGVVRVTPSGCLGPCSEGCSVVVYPDGVWYGKVRVVDIGEIVEEHLKKGQPVERLVLADELLD